MPQDVPQFMQTMVEQDSGNDVLEPLRNDILKDDELPESKDEPKTEAEPSAEKTEQVDTDNNGGESKPTNEDGVTGAGEDGAEKENNGGTDNKQPTDDTKDEKPKEESKPDNAKIVEKTADQIEAAAKGQGNEKLKQAIDLANKFQLVNVDMPKSKDFVLDDGSIDLDSYSKSLITNTVMAIQKSLVGGPLSAALYGVLNTAMTEEQATAQEEKEINDYATGIYNDLVKNFPILSKDKEIEESFDSLLQGENLKRTKLAEQMAKEGKTLPRMEYADYEKLLIRLVGKRNADPTKEEADPVETLKGGVVMNGGAGTPGGDTSDPDIAAMMRVKSKNLFE